MDAFTQSPSGDAGAAHAAGESHAKSTKKGAQQSYLQFGPNSCPHTRGKFLFPVVTLSLASQPQLQLCEKLVKSLEI